MSDSSNSASCTTIPRSSEDRSKDPVNSNNDDDRINDNVTAIVEAQYVANMTAEYKAAGIMPMSINPLGEVVLLCMLEKRRDGKVWLIDIGGKIEPGDNKVPWNTARREFIEETGTLTTTHDIPVDPLHVMKTMHLMTNRHYIVFLHYIDYIPGKELAKTKFAEDNIIRLKWCKLKDLRKHRYRNIHIRLRVIINNL
jgi:8-oxo-dGTP pyrophosphatase MutT (NUDIX family)